MEKDILEDLKLKTSAYKVPEGYFDSLPSQVLSKVHGGSYTVVGEDAIAGRFPLWIKVRPALALAASILALVVAGTALIKGTAGVVDDVDMQDYAAVVSLITSTGVSSAFDEESDALSGEDIEDYLISTGTSVDHITYLAGNYER